MFQRFTHQARQVVIEAQRHARELRQDRIGTEHLLLGLLSEGRGVTAGVLAGFGVEAEGTRAMVLRVVGLGVPNEPDAAALEAIGIDLEEVRRKVEAAFGSGALGRRRRGRELGRRLGHVPFTPRAKKVLELSLRQALSLRHNHIGTEHILLALLAEGEGLAALVLSQKGVRFDEARSRILEELDRPASG